MSNMDEESKEVGVPDEALPADLVPDQDNPLAEGLPPGERAGDLLEEGKDPEQTAYAPAEGTGTDGATGDPPPPEESSEPQET
ncbi:hypothetical protein [Nocardioides sp. TF02-7]|uniref:hypothetical protein n=1 Tax=Nocardioides sp. TF02-7 TaxID=2917724 RepID=UPI001F06470F|nr:hypothetical protein [Nocardioides sp. TF02-7]UMG92918.1 hypothetical protein MF408_00610 [Nocardioides sp. TF02-7]